MLVIEKIYGEQTLEGGLIVPQLMGDPEVICEQLQKLQGHPNLPELRLSIAGLAMQVHGEALQVAIEHGEAEIALAAISPKVVGQEASALLAWKRRAAGRQLRSPVDRERFTGLIIPIKQGIL